MTYETLEKVPQYPAAGCSIREAEAYLSWRLQHTNPTIAAFHVKGGVKELLRAEAMANDTRIMGKGPDGKAETLGKLWCRIYGEPLIPKRKART